MKRAEQWMKEPGILKRSVRAGILLCIGLVMLAGCFYLYYNRPEENVWIVCLIRETTGYYCPGCGAGRACYHILHGQFYQAFRYNPLLFLLLPWLTLYLVLCMVQWAISGHERISQHIPYWIPYVLLAIVFIYGVARNIDVYPFRLLAPTKVL